jgi:hypothetical protein
MDKEQTNRLNFDIDRSNRVIREQKQNQKNLEKQLDIKYKDADNLKKKVRTENK